MVSNLHDRVVIIPDGVPCGHPGCLSHRSHPCEGCGRIAGKGDVTAPVLGTVGGTPEQSRATARAIDAMFGASTCHDCGQPITGRCTIAWRAEGGREFATNVHPECKADNEKEVYLVDDNTALVAP